MYKIKTLLYKIACLVALLFSFNCTSKKQQEQITNDLIYETSPYLLQHAYNPVNWKAWNEETLELAKKEHKLIIISIGYSACHWCHVMEDESFENDSIAQLMNKNFINIKVDREERPDIDNIYINAVQMMTGSSGWPLNCITLPDGRPIYGGTYFTKDNWKQVLIEISQLYRKEPQKAIAYAERVAEGLQNADLIIPNKEKPFFQKKELVAAVEESKKILDMDNGGFLGAPKFPMPNTLDYLLRYHQQYDDFEINHYVKNTLTKMAYGGIYDQIGGGFSRYSTDDQWRIPHFEKMLYDNAQLVSTYSKAFSQNNNQLFKKVIIETLQFIEQELSANNGAFYSSIDADSRNKDGELEEGIYYLWSKDQLKKLLAEDYTLFCDYYNVNHFGLWEDEKYILIRSQSNAIFAKKNDITLQNLEAKVTSWKSLLLQVRQKRESPNLDDKVLTSWNALMMQGYIDAYKAVGDENYLQKAIDNAEFLIENQLRKDGGLNRSYKNGKSTINAYLEDYAILTQSLISLYEVTTDEKYLSVSKNLMNYTIKHFYDENSGLFFYTSDEDTNLIIRKIEVSDGVISSSNSTLANNLFKLSHYFSDAEMMKMSKEMLNNIKEKALINSLGHSNWLHLMTNFTNPFYEVAIVGEKAKFVSKKLHRNYLPNIITASTETSSNSPLLVHKYIEGETLIYVCVDGTCKMPKSDVSKALQMIKK